MLAPAVHNYFKDVVISVIWHNLGNCRALWFPPIDSKYKHQDALTAFHVRESRTVIGDLCEFKYGDTLCLTKYDRKAASSSTYNNKEVYEKLKKEMCIVVDIAVAISG